MIHNNAVNVLASVNKAGLTPLQLAEQCANTECKNVLLSVVTTPTAPLHLNPVVGMLAQPVTAAPQPVKYAASTATTPAALTPPSTVKKVTNDNPAPVPGNNPLTINNAYCGSKKPLVWLAGQWVFMPCINIGGRRMLMMRRKIKIGKRVNGVESVLSLIVMRSVPKDIF